MEELINRIVKASLRARVAGIAGIIVVLTLLNWGLFIRSIESDIENQEAEQRRLDAQLAEKNEIAQNLNERRRELERLDQKFAEALTELPEKADLDELLAQLNDVGKKSGLEIQHVQPASEVPVGFYAKIPVKMQVMGNYHEIAMFLQEVGNLRRIVNVSDITLKGASSTPADKVLLTGDFMATTFRFLDRSANQGDKKATP
jgi:type IV pilus assembly protein PilO